MSREHKRYYIAYGSNLNDGQMLWRCPTAKALGTGELKGWELLFKGSRTGSYLTIEEAKGGTVPVLIWEVQPEDEKSLDRYEGFPRFYYKKDLKVRYRGMKTGKMRTVIAFAYIMHEDRPFGLPTRTYLEVCEEGYDIFHLDKRFLGEAVERTRKKMSEQSTEEMPQRVIRNGVIQNGYLKGFRLVGGSHGRENT